MEDPGDDQHRWKRQALRRRRWPRSFAWVTAVVVVLAVVVAGVVIHAVRKDRLEAGAKRAGEVTMSGPVISSTAPFRVPNADLLVQASSGRSGSTEDGDHKIRAPRGGVLVRVVWSSTGADSPVPDHTERTPSGLAVRSRGTRVVVDRSVTPGTHEEQAVVALPGDPRDVVLEVRFAGRTQSTCTPDGAVRERSQRSTEAVRGRSGRIRHCRRSANSRRILARASRGVPR